MVTGVHATSAKSKTRRQEDKERGREGETCFPVSRSPCLPLSPSRCLLVTLFEIENILSINLTSKQMIEPIARLPYNLPRLT
jgi:hypothetical protein